MSGSSISGTTRPARGIVAARSAATMSFCTHASAASGLSLAM